ncbi:hypothetical protein [Haploplasma axanthum]|uniref:hypothetical protein n=1 Tax=Haploplasma axanthum TaxID=29552 RepID=UPI00138AC833|nr:hypothetical protein [Haploplasma axanthum]
MPEISKAANEEGYDISIETCVMQPILIHTENGTEEGYFIDFNDDNGYIVVGDKLTIYDLVFLRNNRLPKMRY